MAKKEVDLKSLLVESDTVTANHILFKEFIDKTKWKGLPKVIFYIIVAEEFGGLGGKDEKGLFGYRLKIKE